MVITCMCNHSSDRQGSGIAVTTAYIHRPCSSHCASGIDIAHCSLRAIEDDRYATMCESTELRYANRMFDFFATARGEPFTGYCVGLVFNMHL